jgi:hypothetical protein
LSLTQVYGLNLTFASKSCRIKFAMHKRTFTLSEACSLIPKLRQLVAQVISEVNLLAEMQAEIDRAREKAELDGGSLLGTAYLKHLTAFGQAVESIESLGVEIKDLRTGLIDFPHEHQGRIVYLCWKFGEDGIGWWHEVDAGFAGRQPLTDDFC